MEELPGCYNLTSILLKCQFLHIYLSERALTKWTLQVLAKAFLKIYYFSDSPWMYFLKKLNFLSICLKNFHWTPKTTWHPYNVSLNNLAIFILKRLEISKNLSDKITSMGLSKGILKYPIFWRIVLGKLFSGNWNFFAKFKKKII